MSFQDPSSIHSDDLITDINVTPFVDVVLVLLILFMLAAPTFYQSAIKVELPTSTSASQFKHITLKLFVTKKGEAFLEKEKLTAATIASVIKQALAIDPSVDAIISADKDASHGAVLHVIDALRGAGIKSVAIGTRNS
jgi:biopolymer transport protein TolR